MYWVDYDLNLEWVCLWPIRIYKTPGSSCWDLLNGVNKENEIRSRKRKDEKDACSKINTGSFSWPGPDSIPTLVHVFRNISGKVVQEWLRVLHLYTHFTCLWISISLFTRSVALGRVLNSGLLIWSGSSVK